VISCMGAGGKADPTRVHISDLRSASRKQLATAARQRLRMWQRRKPRTPERRLQTAQVLLMVAGLSCVDDDSKLAVVFSSEKVVAKLAAITDEQKEEGMHNFGAVDNMRVRVWQLCSGL